MDENDVAFLKRVTRFTPPQFFLQPAVENDLSQFLKFFLPLFGFAEKEIDLGIHSTLCHRMFCFVPVCPRKSRWLHLANVRRQRISTFQEKCFAPQSSGLSGE